MNIKVKCIIIAFDRNMASLKSIFNDKKGFII